MGKLEEEVVPFYTYRCPRCGASAEELRPMDDAKKNLPVCYDGDVPIDMEPVITPVAGVVRNPAVPRRTK